MHSCPICGQACDCDWEDTWFEDIEECFHHCDDWDIDDDYEYEEDTLDGYFPDEEEVTGIPAGAEPDTEDQPVPQLHGEREGDVVHVYAPERAASLRGMGIDPERVPIRSIIPVWVDLPIGSRLAYMMDVARLSSEQQERLAADIAERFGEPREGLRERLLELGVPILVEDTVAVSTNMFRYL